MFKQVIVLFAILLAIEVNSASVKNVSLAQVDPYAFIDQAKQELALLRQLVEGTIFAADYDLANLDSDFATFAADTTSKGETAVQLQSVLIATQLETITYLAQSAGLDIVYINYCLQDRVQSLNSLFEVILNELRDCGKKPVKEASGIISDSRNIVDVTIDKVNDLDWQLHLCTTPSIQCLSPIVKQIELQTIQLPQKIITQVNQASDLLKSSKISIQLCSDVKVAGYSSNGLSTISNIANCINSYLGV